MTTDNNNPLVDDFEEMKVEIIPNMDSLSTIIKSEVDIQISTAKAFPRNLKKFMAKVESIATTSQAIAESCSYALPRKEKDKKTGNFVNKIISGPSIRLAEIVVSSYGNVRAGARIIANNGRKITAQGVFHDLESNTFISIEVDRSIVNKAGKTYTEDMQVVTGNAACAIAFRNAAFRGIPGALMIEVYENIKSVAKGDAKTLVERRDKAMKFFKDNKVTKEQIFDALEVKDLSEIDLDKLAILSGMKVAFMNNEATLEDLFPTEEKKARDKANAGTEDALNLMDSKSKTSGK